MADAFISYSRKNKALAVALKDGLEAAGFEILFDLEDILGSEDWSKRLTDMIAAADHFVFVISPDSCESRVCSLEINTAVDLSKSILPVLLQASTTVPEAIAARQWLACPDGADLPQCVQQLGALFKTSPDWVRQHTHLTGRARDWRLDRRRSALLRGADLRGAERWFALKEGKEPPPSQLQVEFIESSRAWRRTSRTIGAVLLGTLIASAAIGWSVIDAERRLSADNERVSIAVDWTERDPTKAALVLLEVTDPERTPYAVASLSQLTSQPVATCEFSTQPDRARHVQLSPAGDYVLMVAADSVARIWSAAACSDQPLRELKLRKGVDQAIVTGDGQRVIGKGDDEVAMWRIDGTRVGPTLAGNYYAMWLDQDGDVVALGDDFKVEIWTASATALTRNATYTPFANRPGYGAIRHAEYSRSARKLLIETHGDVILAWTIGDASDAQVLPGSRLLALSADGSSYAHARYAQQSTPTYRAFYEVLVRDVIHSEPEPRTFAEHDELIDVGAFSPDGAFLVTASRDGVIEVSNVLDETKPPARLVRHTRQIRGLLMASAGDRFLSYGDDRTPLLWQFNNLESPTPFKGHTDTVIDAAFSADGSVLATASEDGSVRLWNLGPSAEPILLKTRGQIVSEAWFTPDDRYIVARSSSRQDSSPVISLEAWTPGSDAPPIQLNEPPADIRLIAPHPSAAAIVVATEDGTILSKSIEPSASFRTVGVHPEINSLAFDDVGNHLLSGAADGTLRVWDTVSGGSTLLSLPPDSEIVVLQAALKKDPRNEALQEQLIEKALLSSARGEFIQLGMNSRKRRVLAADSTSVYSWPLDAPTRAVHVDPGDKLIEAAAFDPTGELVATAHAWDYAVRLWRADGSGLVRKLGAATGSIEALRFSPDGKQLIVASKDETLRIWRTDRSGPPVVLRGHTSWVVDADFSRDSRRVVTMSYDHSARVWNVDGSNEEIILGHGSYSARFDSTGSRVVTAGGDGRVGVWSLDGRHLQSAIAARTHMCLDEAFRMRFLAEEPATAADRRSKCRRARQ